MLILLLIGLLCVLSLLAVVLLRFVLSLQLVILKFVLIDLGFLIGTLLLIVGRRPFDSDADCAIWQ